MCSVENSIDRKCVPDTGGGCLSRIIRTAIVATVSDFTRQETAFRLADEGVELLGAAANGASALDLLERLRPDLLIADALLPGMDGCALARRALNGFCLPVRPAVILLYRGDVPPADAESLPGAECVRCDPAPASLSGALQRLRAGHMAFSLNELRRVDALLNALGVPDHIGRDCLKFAALICAADVRCAHALSRWVYPEAGEMCACSAAQAQRAMRHVIECAWKSDQFDNQYRIFADTVDARRGQPTLSEMICRLADILRLEG